eukprot:gene5398-5620_t
MLLNASMQPHLRRPITRKLPERGSIPPSVHAPSVGLVNRCRSSVILSARSGNGGDGDKKLSSQSSSAHRTPGSGPVLTDAIARWWSSATSKLSYNYYIWRQGTSNDLQLVGLFFVCFVLGTAVLKSVAIQNHWPASTEDYWSNLYDVSVLSFGQEFPLKAPNNVPDQVFFIMVATAGLTSITVILALLQQTSLELVFFIMVATAGLTSITVILALLQQASLELVFFIMVATAGLTSITVILALLQQASLELVFFIMVATAGLTSITVILALLQQASLELVFFIMVATAGLTSFTVILALLQQASLELVFSIMVATAGLTSFTMILALVQQASLELVFSIMVATAGLTSFTMILALVQQASLELVDANVRSGSRVYEQNHILVLGWGVSDRDVEVVWKILKQLSYAYRNDGGRIVVVMTLRGKIEMETQSFVFRTGSPLVPADLHFVAAEDAAVAIIVSDQSLDTNLISATHMARMVQEPYVATVSKELMDFQRNSNMFVHHCPQVVGSAVQEYASPSPTPL